MQENRTPAPQSGEPRNQKPAAESPNPRKPPATRQSGPAERVGHTAQPTPSVQNPWGPAMHSHRQGEGTQHTQAPCQPLAGHHSQPRSLESTQHTHTRTGRPATRSARWSTVLGARLPHSTLRGTQVTSSHCDGEWQHPPCRAAPLSEDSRSACHRKFQPHHVGASPVTSRGDKSHQMGHHAMTWPPHPSAGPAAPCCGHFPPGSATAPARLLERARFPETSSRAAGSHAQVGTGSPTAAPRSFISLGVPGGGGGGGGARCARGPITPDRREAFGGGGGRRGSPRRVPLRNQMLRTPEGGAPGTAHEGRGESRELNEMITNWEACTSSMFGSSS